MYKENKFIDLFTKEFTEKVDKLWRPFDDDDEKYEFWEEFIKIGSTLIKEIPSLDPVLAIEIMVDKCKTIHLKRMAGYKNDYSRFTKEETEELKVEFLEWETRWLVERMSFEVLSKELDEIPIPSGLELYNKRFIEMSSEMIKSLRRTLKLLKKDLLEDFRDIYECLLYHKIKDHLKDRTEAEIDRIIMASSKKIITRIKKISAFEKFPPQEEIIYFRRRLNG